MIQEVKRVKLSDMQGRKEVKIVQVFCEDEPCLPVGPIYGLHYRILQKFLDKKSLCYSETELLDGGQGPSRFGPKYQVTGMGKGIYCSENNELTIYALSKSIDYGIGIDKNHVKQYQEKTGIKIKYR